MMSSSDPELCKKLLDDDNCQPLSVVQDVEEQKYLLNSTKAWSTPKKTRSAGCLPCWCKCILITLGLFMTLTIVLTCIAYVWIKDVVQDFTVTSPHAPFPVVEMTRPELDVVTDRVNLFVDKLRAAQDNSYSDEVPLEPLVVTQDEINGFLSHAEFLRGNIFVTLEQDSILEEYSLPTSMLPGGKGRYFVGHDHITLDTQQKTLQVEMETVAKHHDWFDGPLLFAQLSYLIQDQADDIGALQLFLESGSFFGLEAPEDFIAQRQNLLEHLYEDADCADARAILDGIEGVSIEPGKITVLPHHGKKLESPN